MFTENGVTEPLRILEEEMYPYRKPAFNAAKTSIEEIIPGELTADDRQDINRAFVQYKMMGEFGYYKYANKEAIVKYTCIISPN